MKKNRKKNHKKSASSTTNVCIYYKNKDGMGGIAVDVSTQEKFYISHASENFALDKDEVQVLSKLDKIDKNGKRSGIIQKITKHNTTNLVGSIQKYKTKYLLNVNNIKFGSYLVIIDSENIEFTRDELYNTVITKYPDQTQQFFEVKLINAIGKIGEDKTFIEELIITSGIPISFSQAALDQSRAISDEIKTSEIKNRIDLRHLPFVTIDGEDAKDFDDAVYCEIKNDIYHLYVAIADVSHYVTADSPLDIDAFLRGTSVYFPRRVIPMLPEHLSNGLCSLNPNVDRLIMCCQMQIQPNGTITDYKVYNGVIKSKARLTYTQVQTWIEDNSLIPQAISENICSLYKVFKALLLERNSRGAVDFDTIEPIFLFSEENGHFIVSEIKERIRLEAHRLIEECMLAANVSVANFLAEHGQATLYRIHGKPSIEKFTSLKEYLNSLAIPFDVNYEELKPEDYNKLLEKVKETHKDDFQVIQQSILRSMQLAIYSPNNIGHFGLSYKKYLHFTSPIRRYPDLLVHRALKKVIQNMHLSYAQPLEYIGEYASLTERRAEDVERKIDAFYKCQFAKSHIGSNFDGVIITVTSFGLFVYIPHLLLDGLIHITELGSDYFIFDEKKQLLIGKNTGIKYKAGQAIKVQIASVDMANLFINLIPQT